jgi:hypothetical protein
LLFKFCDANFVQIFSFLFFVYLWHCPSAAVAGNYCQLRQPFQASSTCNPSMTHPQRADSHCLRSETGNATKFTLTHFSGFLSPTSIHVLLSFTLFSFLKNFLRVLSLLKKTFSQLLVCKYFQRVLKEKGARLIRNSRTITVL